MEFDAGQVKDQIVQWIKDYFHDNGLDCNAVIGISAGKDSTIAAALCVEALGKDRVIGVLMPDGEQADIAESYEVCKFLGIDHFTINIGGATRHIKHEVRAALNGHWSNKSGNNLPPRIRMSTLYAIAQTMNGRVVNTCNLSEEYIGWSTRYGDSVGDFAPLRMLTATEVCLIGHALGLPAHLVDKAPSDGLTGKTDEDNFGFTYEALDKYIRTGVCEDDVVESSIRLKHAQNQFKLHPMPAFEYYDPEEMRHFY